MSRVREWLARRLYRVAMAVDPMPRVEVDRREAHEDPPGIHLTNGPFGI